MKTDQGLGGRMMLDRAYVKRNGEIVRFLHVSIFKTYRCVESRDFIMRLSNDDSREFKHWWGAVETFFDWCKALPINQWCEIVYPSEVVKVAV